MKQLCIILITIFMMGCASAGTHLLTASSAGDLAGVTRAIEEGANVDVRDEVGNTPLINACMACNASVIEFLISRGADCNASNIYGLTPIFLAILKCEPGLISTLIKKGAAVNVAATEKSVTPLHTVFVRENFSVEILQLLLKKGADPNARDKEGKTPLFYLAHPKFALGQDKTVKAASILIDAGARFNEADKDGNTPLHYASRNGISMLAKALIDRGANVNARNVNGDTPLAIVRKEIIRSEGILKGSGGAASMADVVMSTMLKTTKETLLKAGAVE